MKRCHDDGCNADDIMTFLRSNDSSLVERATRDVAQMFLHVRSAQDALEMDVLSALWNMLDNGEAESQKQAVTVISNICRYGTAEQRKIVVSSGVLQSYCAVLARPDHTLAALVLAGLNALVQAAERDDSDSDSEDDCKAKSLCLKLDEIGLLDLVQQLLQRQESDEGLRREALELSTTLRFYARGEDLICEDRKVFTPVEIVHELKSADLVGQVGAARAARRMLCRARGEGLLRLRAVSDTMVPAGIYRPIPGVLPPLIAALRKDCPDLRREAAGVLSIITCIKKHIMDLVRGGVIPELVTLIQKGEESAGIAVGNIASLVPTTRDDVLYCGAVEALEPYLRRETPLTRLRVYVSTYEKLCYHHFDKGPDTFDHLSKALPCMPELLDIGDQQVLVSACGALTHLMHDTYGYMGREAVQTVPGLVDALLALLGSEAASVQGAALKALQNMLSGTYTQVERCLDAGLLDHLMPLLRSSEPSLVVEAAWTTGNFFTSHSQIRRALDKDILTPLLDILDGGEPRCQAEAAWVIGNFCNKGSDKQRNFILSHGVVKRCSALLAARDTTPAAEPSAGRDDLTQNLMEQICRILQVIMYHMLLGIEAVHADPKLTESVVALLGHEATKVRQAAMGAVINMLRRDTQAERCLNAGLLDHLVRLLQSDEPGLVLVAVLATGNIFTRTPSVIQRALEKDVLTPLLEILAHKEQKCKQKAVHAVTNLCKSGSGVQLNQLVSSGVLRPYCSLLAEPHLARTMLDGLDHLLKVPDPDFNGEGLRSQLKNDLAGFLYWIRKLSTDANDLVKTKAVNVLKELKDFC